MLNMLQLAAKVALPNNNETDARSFWLGCIGVRNDGKIVFSKNGAVYSTSIVDYQLIPNSHAEGRVLRKMDWGGTLYVARVKKIDGTLACSAPCSMCAIRIKAKGIKKVFYTINNFQYGLWDVRKDIHTIFNCKCK
jgi:tRNA(Arg) A34 adenosine deaminase TadA